MTSPDPSDFAPSEPRDSRTSDHAASDPAFSAESSNRAEEIARYEPYLRMLARMQMRANYKAKLGASDIVQQTMLQAVAAIDQYRGTTEAEWRAWLRKILVRQMCHLDRDLHRDKRDIRREQSMEQRVAQSSMRLEGLLAGDVGTPSQHAMVGESLLTLADAIESLPEAQRDAISLHYLEGLKLSDVAERMDKTAGSVAGLLHRGMKQLRQNFHE
ncbi:sigma-70 family RNA polymerase sigma factor [Rhodopirellula sp. P2]|uniref:sigma-70 family RNA polymerase sigma factor n=1 Tax=Rhodopirellula sp. P2 TaxID=2127060 RepID=UPI002367FB6E|nr:sigma-70 family RNA polymerase sigma factor [Rhodopirellula sp. P2]WDQ18792.1 sigma-70 family RNA polymerase sigma factor [Rhodopirellula sp. P2]